MSLSVQVVDGVYGMHAAGIAVRLDLRVNGEWTELDSSHTDGDGQAEFCRQERGRPGSYRLVFGTDPYFIGLGVTPFYPAITVELRIADPSYAHQVRLLLSPSSYLAYWQR